MKFIGYYRVSTKEQGDSGLGLAAQKEAVNRYVSSVGGDMIGEFTDVISGKIVDRSGLNEAIELAVSAGAILVVKRLDRLTREGYQITVALAKQGVKYIESDSPGDEDFIKDIKLAIAKEEAQKISNRTKDALAQIKGKLQRGETHISKSGREISTLGGTNGFCGKARENAAASKREAAVSNENNRRAWALIKPLHEAGFSFYAITKQLNNNGFTASRGGAFNVKQVTRVVQLYA